MALEVRVPPVVHELDGAGREEVVDSRERRRRAARPAGPLRQRSASTSWRPRASGRCGANAEAASISAPIAVAAAATSRPLSDGGNASSPAATRLAHASTPRLAASTRLSRCRARRKRPTTRYEASSAMSAQAVSSATRISGASQAKRSAGASAKSSVATAAPTTIGVDIESRDPGQRMQTRAFARISQPRTARQRPTRCPIDRWRGATLVPRPPERRPAPPHASAPERLERLLGAVAPLAVGLTPMCVCSHLTPASVFGAPLAVLSSGGV